MVRLHSCPAPFWVLGLCALALVAQGCSSGSKDSSSSGTVAGTGSGSTGLTGSSTAPGVTPGPGGSGTTSPPQPPDPNSTTTPANLKVAFIGDSGAGADAKQVLTLIKNEGTDFVVHQGDFDYSSDPQAFDDHIDSILGANYPYFGSPGNHDSGAWSGANEYQKKFEARLNRLGIKWEGSLGEQSTLTYQGIFLILIGPDVTGPGNGLYDGYVRDRLAANNSVWSVVSWHKNQNAMQCGTKGDEAGWGVYEESRKGGAIIATGHEHSYTRTYTMSHMENLTTANTNPDLVTLAKDDPNTAADEGRSFVFVSGLGGRGVRNQDRTGNWWASIYTSDQAGKHGALFGVFNYNGNPKQAFFYFKNVDGQIIDQFTVDSTL